MYEDVDSKSAVLRFLSAYLEILYTLIKKYICYYHMWI